MKLSINCTILLHALVSDYGMCDAFWVCGRLGTILEDKEVLQGGHICETAGEKLKMRCGIFRFVLGALVVFIMDCAII